MTVDRIGKSFRRFRKSLETEEALAMLAGVEADTENYFTSSVEGLAFTSCATSTISSN
jgi:hypothetical protein